MKRVVVAETKPLRVSRALGSALRRGSMRARPERSPLRSGSSSPKGKAGRPNMPVETTGPLLELLETTRDPYCSSSNWRPEVVSRSSSRRSRRLDGILVCAAFPSDDDPDGVDFFRPCRHRPRRRADPRATELARKRLGLGEDDALHGRLFVGRGSIGVFETAGAPSSRGAYLPGDLEGRLIEAGKRAARIRWPRTAVGYQLSPSFWNEETPGVPCDERHVQAPLSRGERRPKARPTNSSPPE